MTRVVPTYSTESPGSFLTGGIWNAQVRDGGNWFVDRMAFVGVQQTRQSVTNNAWVSISFDTSPLDSDGGHNNSTNNSQWVAPTAGWVWVHGWVAFDVNSTGARGACISVNGTRVNGTSGYAGASPANATAIAAGGLISVNVGDYVELQGYQTTSVALNTIVAADVDCRMSLWWVTRGF